MNAIFDHVPLYPLVFAVFWGAAVLFALAMARHLRVFAAARASGPSPLDDAPARIRGLIQYAFVQTKMFKDPRAAILHFGIFWGFILLTIGTANVVTGGVIQQVLSAPFGGVLWAAVLAMQNVVAVGVIAFVLWAFERRLISKPPRLTYNLDALAILGMIGVLVAAEFFAQAFEIARYGAQPGAFITSAIAQPLGGIGGLSREQLEIGFSILWWLHMLIVAAFLVYLPFSKHLHIATAFPNIYFRKLKPRGELPKMDLEDENATFGLRTASSESAGGRAPPRPTCPGCPS